MLQQLVLSKVTSTETEGSDSVIVQLEWIHMWKDV